MTPDYVESLPYIIYTVPAAIIFFIGMLLGPTVLPLCLVAIESAQWGLNQWRNIKRRASNLTEEPAAHLPRRFAASDLRSGIALVSLAMPISMALAYATFAWYWVWVLPGLATVLCAHWWLKLRRDRVLHAEAYAIALWIAPHIVWGMITIAVLPFTSGKLLPFFHQEVQAESMLGAIYGGQTALAIATGSAIAAAAASLAIASQTHHHTKWLPLCLIGTIPSATYFWFAQPLGFAHIGFTAIVAGYAITKEYRRLHHLPAHTVEPVTPTRPIRYVTVAVCIASTAAALWLYIPYLADPALWDDGGPVRMVLTLTVAAGTLGMLILTALTLTSIQAAYNYRAATFGLGAMLLFALAFNLPGYDDYPVRWTIMQWLATTATCGTIAFVMWRIFGPGAITYRAQETEMTLRPGTP